VDGGGKRRAWRGFTTMHVGIIILSLYLQGLHQNCAGNKHTVRCDLAPFFITARIEYGSPWNTLMLMLFKTSMYALVRCRAL
jgi:hypothetical protein